MAIKELGHVVLYVRDLERSRVFYRDVLGFNEVFVVPSAVAGFSSGRTHHELMLMAVGPDAEPIPRGRRVGLYHFALKVRSVVDRLVAELLEPFQAGFHGLDRFRRVALPIHDLACDPQRLA